MINKQQKKEILEKVNAVLSDSKSVAFTNFSKIKVEDLNDFRGELRKEGCNYKVIKKTLLTLGLKNKGYKNFNFEEKEGSIGIIYSQDEEVLPLKKASDFSKKDKNFNLFNALVDGSLVGEEDAKKLAKLPGKDVLRAQLVGTIKAPINGFVNVLSGNIRGFVNVLKAKAEKENK